MGRLVGFLVTKIVSLRIWGEYEFPVLKDTEIALDNLLHILFCGPSHRHLNVIELYIEPAPRKKKKL